jgi:hypothetical protein
LSFEQTRQQFFDASGAGGFQIVFAAALPGTSLEFRCSWQVSRSHRSWARDKVKGGG